MTVKAVAKAPYAPSRVPKGFNLLLEKLNDIPTLPYVATKVNELIHNPNSSSAEIAEWLKKDQVLTAKVLKLINSPYYAIPGGVTDVQRALAYLGFNTIAQLVLGLSVFSVFPKEYTEEFSLIQFWRHALATAVCSEVIARHIKFPKPEEAFTCGLLHDVGKIVMHQVAREMLLEIVAVAKEGNKSFAEAESELDVPGHAFLGEYMASKWGLPQSIRAAIRYHHLDIRNASTILPGLKPMIHIVSLANALVVNMGVGHSGDYSDGRMKPHMREVLQLVDTDLDAIRKTTEEETRKAESFMAIYS